jgi:excisionase family DNA binding protein
MNDMILNDSNTTINDIAPWSVCDEPAPTQPVSHPPATEQVTVQAATQISGYSAQYLRRLLRAGRLTGVRNGQLWLIDLDSLNAYLYRAISENDMRYGPHKAWLPPF